MESGQGTSSKFSGTPNPYSLNTTQQEDAPARKQEAAPSQFQRQAEANNTQDEASPAAGSEVGIETLLKERYNEKNMGARYNIERDMKLRNKSTEDGLAAQQLTGLTFEDFQKYRELCRNPSKLPADHVYRGYDNLNVTADGQYIPELTKLGDNYVETFKPKKRDSGTARDDDRKVGFNDEDWAYHSKRSTWYRDGDELTFATTMGKSAHSFAFKSPSKSDVSFDLESARDNPYSSSILSL